MYYLIVNYAMIWFTMFSKCWWCKTFFAQCWTSHDQRWTSHNQRWTSHDQHWTSHDQCWTSHNQRWTFDDFYFQQFLPCENDAALSLWIWKEFVLSIRPTPNPSKGGEDEIYSSQSLCLRTLRRVELQRKPATLSVNFSDGSSKNFSWLKQIEFAI